MEIILGILLIAAYLLPLCLLARCSHWTHKAQERLETTNQLLDSLIHGMIAMSSERKGSKP